MSETTELPNDFIDKYMRGAPDAYYALVYIAAYRQKDGLAAPPIPMIAKSLGVSETVVRDSLIYWRDEGLISFDGEKARFRSPNSRASGKVVVMPAPADSYSPDEIRAYLDRSEEFRALTDKAQRIFGRPLALTDMNTLLSLIETHGLPTDVIAELLAYCEERKKTRSVPRGYIETIAMDWKSRGVKTAAEALSFGPAAEKRKQGERKNRFVNFEQSQTEYSSYERVLHEKMLREGF